MERAAGRVRSMRGAIPTKRRNASRATRLGNAIGKRLQNIMEEYAVLDIETQRWAEEVPGGWDNIPGFGVAVAVAKYCYETVNSFGYYVDSDLFPPKDWFTAGEYEVGIFKIEALIKHLQQGPTIVTFNGINFDYEVLRPYGLEPETLYPKSFDILHEMTKVLGHRVSLESVAQATLGRGKIGSGIEAVQDFKDGLIGRVIEYCKCDVEITQQIYEFAKRNGFVNYTDLKGGKQQCKLTLETET